MLTADTIVVLDGNILGKPHDRTEAIEMLERLSGKAHRVITGVSMRSGGGIDGDGDNIPGRRIEFSVESTVRFRKLTIEEIEYYVETHRPMDKAGAYGIQEWIGYVGIERIEGSFHNVMGLPIQTIYTKLQQFI